MGKVNIRVVIGMVMAEFAQVGLMILSKSAISDGMSKLVFVFYSNVLASLILLPCSFLFHRFTSLHFLLYYYPIHNSVFSFNLFCRSERPPLTLTVVLGCFLLGLLGYANSVSSSWCCYLIILKFDWCLLIVCYAVWVHKWVDMLVFTTAHLHLPPQCLILSLALPSYLLFFSGNFALFLLVWLDYFVSNLYIYFFSC